MIKCQFRLSFIKICPCIMILCQREEKRIAHSYGHAVANGCDFIKGHGQIIQIDMGNAFLLIIFSVYGKYVQNNNLRRLTLQGFFNIIIRNPHGLLIGTEIIRGNAVFMKQHCRRHVRIHLTGAYKNHIKGIFLFLIKPPDLGSHIVLPFCPFIPEKLLYIHEQQDKNTKKHYALYKGTPLFHLKPSVNKLCRIISRPVNSGYENHKDSRKQYKPSEN